MATISELKDRLETSNSTTMNTLIYRLGIDKAKFIGTVLWPEYNPEPENILYKLFNSVLEDYLSVATTSEKGTALLACTTVIKNFSVEQFEKFQEALEGELKAHIDIADFKAATDALTEASTLDNVMEAADDASLMGRFEDSNYYTQEFCEYLANIPAA